MFKVKVKDIPVFYAGKRYGSGEELIIEGDYMNDDLFDKIEEIENVPFKGVKEATLRKVLEAAKVEIPEEADRDALIRLMNDNQVTL